MSNPEHLLYDDRGGGEITPGLSATLTFWVYWIMESSSEAQTPASQVTLMVTGTSGSLSYTTPVTITINPQSAIKFFSSHFRCERSH